MSIAGDLIRGHTDAIILARLLKSDSYGYEINKIIWMMGALRDLEARGETLGKLDVSSGTKADFLSGATPTPAPTPPSSPLWPSWWPPAVTTSWPT